MTEDLGSPARICRWWAMGNPLDVWIQKFQFQEVWSVSISRVYLFLPATGRRNGWSPVLELSFLFMRSCLATPGGGGEQICPPERTWERRIWAVRDLLSVEGLIHVGPDLPDLKGLFFPTSVFMWPLLGTFSPGLGSDEPERMTLGQSLARAEKFISAVKTFYRSRNKELRVYSQQSAYGVNT